MHPNVFLLSCAMALGLAGAPVIVLLGGIIGTELAPSPGLATLPVAALVTGVALFTVPAALAMQHVGRKRGFILSSLAAAAGSLLGIAAIAKGSFVLFCLTAVVIGANLAFVQQYRFAAAECVTGEAVGRAVSYVLLGGIAAAFLGPEVARQTRDLLPWGLYSGSFAALAVIYVACAVVLGRYREPPRAEDESRGESRPLGEVVRQPLYLTAVMAGLTSFGVMSFIMTATPVSMHVLDGFSIDETTRVIQSHIMAMYIPSLFTGRLLGRFGLKRIMIAGTLLMAACAAVALVERHFMHYWTGLVLLGVGWNFLFVGGTTLLTRTYRPSERFRAQAVNDFAVFGFQALASLTAGAVIFQAGWETLNVLSLPLLALMLFVIYRTRYVTGT
jgi:MFS family permease